MAEGWAKLQNSALALNDYKGNFSTIATNWLCS